MALSAATVWEFRHNTGSSVQGGGFVAGATGSDMSVFANKNTSGGVDCFSTTADLSTTDAVAVGTTTITSATANFSSALVGNIVYFEGGSGTITAVRRQVVSVTNATTIVLDASIAASVGMTMNIGGAVDGINTIYNVAVPGNRAWMKNDGVVAHVVNVSRTVTSGTLTAPLRVTGYNSTRGDITTGTIVATHTAAGFLNSSLFPVIAISGASNITFGTYTRIEGISFTGNVSGAALVASSGTAGSILYRCIIYNDDATTGSATAHTTMVDCDFSSNGADSGSGGLGLLSGASPFSVACRYTASNGNAIVTTSSPSSIGCVFYNVIAASGAIVSTGASSNIRCINCTFDGITGPCVTLADVALSGPSVLLINNQITNAGAVANNARSGTQVVGGLNSFYNRIRDTATLYAGFFDNTAIGDITTAQSDAAEYVSRGSLNFRLLTAAAGIGKGLNYGTSTGAFQRYTKELVATDVASGTKFGQDNTTLGTFDEGTGSFSGSGGSGGGGGRIIGG